MAFPDAVFAALRSSPARVAVEHGSREVTAAELLVMARHIAAGLRAQGVKQGTGIAMDTSVTPEALAAYLAGWALGARVVGIRPGFSTRQREHILGSASLLVTDSVVASLLESPSEPLLLTSRPGDIAR